MFELCGLFWAEGPGPVFGFFAEAAANGIHFDVVGFFFEFCGGAEAVVEEVRLPLNRVVRRDVMFPATDRGVEAGFAWGRDDGVEVVGHE